MRFAALAPALGFTLALGFTQGSVEAAPAYSHPANTAIVKVRANRAKKNKSNAHKPPKRKPRSRVIHTR
jgi:hypothetical protein